MYHVLCIIHLYGLWSLQPCRESLEGWDPMKLDYTSKEFNSYEEGPGQRLETRDQKDVTLFVDNIPAMITKVSHNICSVDEVWQAHGITENGQSMTCSWYCLKMLGLVSVCAALCLESVSKAVGSVLLCSWQIHKCRWQSRHCLWR